MRKSRQVMLHFADVSETELESIVKSAQWLQYCILIEFCPMSTLASEVIEHLFGENGSTEHSF